MLWDWSIRETFFINPHQISAMFILNVILLTVVFCFPSTVDNYLAIHLTFRRLEFLGNYCEANMDLWYMVAKENLRWMRISKKIGWYLKNNDDTSRITMFYVPKKCFSGIYINTPIFKELFYIFIEFGFGHFLGDSLYKCILCIPCTEKRFLIPEQLWFFK